VLFVLPAALLLWILSLLYVVGQNVPLLHAFFEGLKPAVVAIVASALWRIGARTVTTPMLGAVALLAFFLFAFHASYPAVVIGFGLFGFFFLGKDQEHQVHMTQQQDWLASIRVALLLLALWAIPTLALFLWLGSKALPVKIGLFFGKVALFSFGGAYAALSYVSLHSATDWGWVTSSQMMDGLGLAETTPGPLLITLQFVAFLASYNHPGILSPLLAATLGSLTGLWSLFLPSFLWIFTLAPHMEYLSSQPRMNGALTAIGAVVTAVIAYLALWFAENLFFPQGLRLGSLVDIAWRPLILAMISFALLVSRRIGMVPLILLAGGLGVILKVVV
jgi:chromate transporter